MSKVTKHNLQLQIDTLKGFRVSMQAEINGMKEWISDIEKQQTQPNVTLPKSTRYDAEVLSRLDSLEARMAKVEGMLKTEPETYPEPQTERKVVFDWHVHAERGIEKPLTRPQEYKTIEEIFKIGENSYLFKASFGQIYNTLTYIGHYE
jgi:hypothetical protein